MPHIYEDILGNIQKPVRYLGNEWNAIRKTGASVKKRVALCFPDTYEIGMSHLGLRILYSILNKREDTAAERAYCPWVDMEQQLRNKNLPLVSMETQIPLNEFDVVGFSLQYELEYTNILTMLDLGRIPLYAADRQIKDPLVIGGGPCAFSPEPIADFFDCFLIGDGEEAFPRIIDTFVEHRDQGLSRREVLIRIAQMDGVYVPLLYDTQIDPETGFEVVQGSDVAPFPVKRTYVKDINDYPFPSDILVPSGDIVHDRVSMEIARGCTEGCRFCQAGTIYRPVRERKPEDIINTIMESLDKTGFDQASLTSLSTADFSCIGPLAQKLSDELEKRRTAMAVSSMRVYGMTDSLGESLSKVRRSGFTIAPEAGSQRMRDVINKGITEEVILGGANTAFRNGWSHVKLYFMIGLPTETEEDLRAIVDLGGKILNLAEKEHGKKAQVTISVSSHIPKPHAPFQWLALDDLDSLREKHKYLLRLLKPYKRIRFKWHDVEHSWLEAVFSRGDRRLARALELAYRKGCRFDAWTDQLKLKKWYDAFKELEIDTSMWMKDIPLYSPLPWDHLDSLVKKDWLIRELKRSLKGKFSPACEKPFKKKDELHRTDLGKPTESDKLVCYHCGLECDLDAIRQERIASWNSLEQGIPLKNTEVSAGMPDAEVAVTRYRASYGKLDSFRYLSALDLTRALTRAFSRSRVPLRFSEGFHPTPSISYGPALPVGMESAEEFLDFETLAHLPEEELLQMLNAELPEGLRFTTMHEIERNADSLFQVINAAEYTVVIDPESGTGEFARLNRNAKAAHETLINEFLLRESIEVEKVSKGRKRLQDIRPMIHEVAVENTTSPLHLRMVLATGGRGNLRPEVILKELYGESADLMSIRRERLLVEVGGAYLSPVEVGNGNR